MFNSTRSFLPAVFCAISIVTFTYSTSSAKAEEFKWQQGDIIATEGKSSQSSMIKAATNSKWTHIGVVVIDANGGKKVFEAVQPVRFTTVKKFLKNAADYKVLRMKRPIVLDRAKVTKARTFVKTNVNKNYDLKFGWGDDKLYCSELVWKLYKKTLGVELCKPRSFQSFNLKHPKVKQAIIKRYGSLSKIPKNHKVVAPSDIVSSSLLKDVTPLYKAKK